MVDASSRGRPALVIGRVLVDCRHDRQMLGRVEERAMLTREKRVGLGKGGGGGGEEDAEENDEENHPTKEDEWLVVSCRPGLVEQLSEAVKVERKCEYVPMRTSVGC